MNKAEGKNLCSVQLELI